MTKELSYLLGVCFSLLDQCRTYFIHNGDEAGVGMIEDQYQSLKKEIENTIYKPTMKDHDNGK